MSKIMDSSYSEDLLFHVGEELVNSAWFNSVWTVQETIITNRNYRGIPLYDGKQHLCRHSINNMIEGVWDYYQKNYFNSMKYADEKVEEIKIFK